MKYRIRLSSGKWYVRQYTLDNQHVADHGPYEAPDYSKAVAWADAQGWQDWDKMQ